MTKPNHEKWIIVAAARPNFMKIAPLMRAIYAFNVDNSALGRHIKPILVHTGQHYDDNMSDAFFRDLHIPQPDIHLGIGSGSHAEQTGRVMIECERILQGEKPHLVIVVGDVNSTMACALAAVKLNIPVAHIEAGLRSFDRTMPEEINRIVTDAVSEYLFTPSPDADENLRHEGIPVEKIFLVGDIMIDTLFYNLDIAKQTNILKRLALNGAYAPKPYALVTLHRPSNVDNKDSFEKIIKGLLNVAQKLPVIFPIHPRTHKQVLTFGLEDAFLFHPVPETGKTKRSANAANQSENSLTQRIRAFPPLGYLDFLNLMAHATVVLTDSGGIQEETTVLNVPCITLRNTTERPITIAEGTNVLVHDDPEKIIAEVDKVLSRCIRKGQCPAIWDGNTAWRIVQLLAARK